MSLESPFFSVIIPTFNRAQLLQEAVQSVLSQTFQDFELLIVDDHSTDGTRAMLAGSSDVRITYMVNERNKGGSGARNTGIQRARGRWVAFLDDDDLWLPNKLEEQHRAILSLDADIGLLYTAYAEFEQDPQQANPIKPPTECTRDGLLYGNCVGALDTVVIPRRVLLEIGGFDERIPARQDIDLYVRIASRYRLLYHDAVLTLVRVAGQDRTSVNWEKRLRAETYFAAKHISFFQHPKAYLHRTRKRFLYALKTGHLGMVLWLLPLTLISLIFAPLDWRTWLRRMRSA